MSDLEPVNAKHLPKLEDKTPRQLVEENFIELGFTDENPSDLDMVTELLQIWIDNTDDKEIVYSPEQYILLNDPDVQTVLNRCKEYYEPKKHLSKGDLRSILEDIARGSLTRKDYDFKNGETIEIEPSFTERLQAIKMLKEEASDDNAASSIQFINNIITPPTSPSNQFHPNMEAPKEPPAGHYSLSLTEPLNDPNSEQTDPKLEGLLWEHV